MQASTSTLPVAGTSKDGGGESGNTSTVNATAGAAAATETQSVEAPAAGGEGQHEQDADADADAQVAALQTEAEKDQTPEELRAELEKLRQELMLALQKKQGIDRQLISHESAIYAFETSYLSVDLSAGPTNATFGNIVKGYDSYLKSGSAAADAARKKQSTSSTRGHGGLGPGYATGIVGPGGSILQPVMDEDRLFSRSSGTYLDSLQLRERDQNHLNALAGMGGGSGGGNGNNTGSDGEELDDGDINDANEDGTSTAGGTTNVNTPITATSAAPPVSATGSTSTTTKDKDKDRDSSAARDAKRQKRK